MMQDSRRFYPALIIKSAEGFLLAKRMYNFAHIAHIAPYILILRKLIVRNRLHCNLATGLELGLWR